MAMASERREFDQDPAAEGQRVGQLVSGKWELEELLGNGAAGSVYAARHRNGHRVAIKIVRSRWAQSPKMRERFLDEARASNRVAHRGVARVHDEGVTEDGSMFLVMDLLEGLTLHDFLQVYGPVSVEQALVVAHELLDVLSAAHSVGVLHRDIKPGNVYLNTDGRVMLLDFGVARLSESRFVTEAGVPIGTPSYMPPEQADGRWAEVDARSDLWSLGATMFTLLTGQTVRQTASLEEELHAARQGLVRSLATVRELPKPVVDLVDRALAPEPRERFFGAHEMRQAVRDAMTALGLALPTATELPGVRAGLLPSALAPPNDDRESSATRLKQPPITLTASAETNQWARKFEGVSRAGYALVVAALAALAVPLWQHSGAEPLLELRAEVGTLYRVQAEIAQVVHGEAVEVVVRDHGGAAWVLLRAAGLAIQNGAEEEEVAVVPPPRPSRAVRRPVRRAPPVALGPAVLEPAASTPTTAAPAATEPGPDAVATAPVLPEPVAPPQFDPLEDRL